MSTATATPAAAKGPSRLVYSGSALLPLPVSSVLSQVVLNGHSHVLPRTRPRRRAALTMMTDLMALRTTGRRRMMRLSR